MAGKGRKKKFWEQLEKAACIAFCLPSPVTAKHLHSWPSRPNTHLPQNLHLHHRLLLTDPRPLLPFFPVPSHLRVPSHPGPFISPPKSLPFLRARRGRISFGLVTFPYPFAAGSGSHCHNTPKKEVPSFSLPIPCLEPIPPRLSTHNGSCQWRSESAQRAWCQAAGKEPRRARYPIALHPATRPEPSCQRRRRRLRYHATRSCANKRGCPGYTEGHPRGTCQTRVNPYNQLQRRREV